jgi:hypothetical protein
MLVIIEVAQTDLARKRYPTLHAIFYGSRATVTDNLLLIACDAGRESERMAFMLLVGELKAYFRPEKWMFSSSIGLT